MEQVYAKYLVEKIKKVPSLSSAVIYKNNGTGWVNIISETDLPDPLLAKHFDSLSADANFVKIKPLSKAAFLLRSPDVVAVLPISIRTPTNTLTQHSNRFDECLTAATSSFHAHYDELTGVLNRHGIRHALNSAISEVRTTDQLGEEPEAQLTSKNDIVLFSFDIDRFKSVNDTMGHGAGDIVLAAFASRLQSLVNDLECEFSGKFVFGRPGGEEFDLLGIGSFSLSDRERLGSRLLDEIRKPLLPELASRKQSLKEQFIPEVENLLGRNSGVTASIGVAWRKLEEKLLNVEALHSSLRKEADAALYRAKADGRDCLRNYNDIRLKHGRVVEYHESARLVQIDIGEKVGVKTGDTFSVFFPPFTGGEKVLESDRSLKVLGEYPAVESARISVISIQGEVSTCEVTYSVEKTSIPVGSRLRYLYVGSKHIALNHREHRLPNTFPLADITNHIKALGDNNQLGAVCLLNLPVAPNSSAQRSKLNEVVIASYLLFRSGSQIFYSMGSNIYVVVPKPAKFKSTEFRSEFEQVAKSLNALFKGLSVGVCVPSSLPAAASQSAEAIMFYCNSLIYQSIEKKKPLVRFFEEITPIHKLFSWKKDQEIWHMMADYQQYRALGFDSPNLHNQVGLAIMENDVSDFLPLATIALQQAVKAEPSQRIFTANLGAALTRQGNFSEAYENFKKVEEFVLSGGISYGLSYAKAALEVLRLKGPIKRTEAKKILMTVSNLSKPLPRQSYFAKLKHEIRMALASGELN